MNANTRTAGTTRWYRSPEVWLILSPLIVTILAMVVTVVILQRSGSVQQYENLGEPLGKVYAGFKEEAGETKE